MPESYEPYEVFAIRYAERDAMHNDHILNRDPHNGPSPMDYFVWAIRGNGRTIVVDVGFEEKEATARGRTLLELSFAWLASRDVIPSIIAGASRPAQVEANVAAADWALTPDEVAEIDLLATYPSDHRFASLFKG